MDPVSRRELWSALISEKVGRTIILTTHFMDQADILGVRIAVMTDGEQKCCGTSFFLKERYSEGYRLVCVKDRDCSSSKIIGFLRRYVPEIDVHEENPSDLSYILPFEHLENYQAMLAKLENQSGNLKINSSGVSSSELEEVFLKVNESENDAVDASIEQEEKYDKYELLGGMSLYWNQCYAKMKKGSHWWISNWILFVVLNVILIFFIVISFNMYRNAYDFNHLPNLNISLSSYAGETVAMIANNDTANPIFAPIFAEYMDLFNEKDGNLFEEFEGDMNEHFLKLGNVIRIRSNTRYLIGVARKGDGLIAYFSNQLYHSASLSLNQVYNSIYKGTHGACAGRISTANWPLPFTAQARVKLVYSYTGLGSQLATNVPFAMAFVIAFHVMFYIQERVSNMKLLQFIGGVHTAIFWVVSFLFDFAAHLVTSLICYITVSAYKEEFWSDIDELSQLFFVLFIFGLAALAVTLLASFAFSHASHGFVTLSAVFILTGNDFIPFLTF